MFCRTCRQTQACHFHVSIAYFEKFVPSCFATRDLTFDIEHGSSSGGADRSFSWPVVTVWSARQCVTFIPLANRHGAAYDHRLQHQTRQPMRSCGVNCVSDRAFSCYALPNTSSHFEKHITCQLSFVLQNSLLVSICYFARGFFIPWPLTLAVY